MTLSAHSDVPSAEAATSREINADDTAGDAEERQFLTAVDYIARNGSVKTWVACGATYSDAAPASIFTHPAWLRAYRKNDLLVVEAARHDTSVPRLVFAREGRGLVHQGRLLRLDPDLIASLGARLMAQDATVNFVVFEDADVAGDLTSKINTLVFHYRNNWRLPLSQVSTRISKQLVTSTKRKARRLAREADGITFRFEAAPNRALLETIADFGRRRMKALRKQYGIDKAEVARLAEAAAEIGHASVVRDENSILAAELIYIAGDQACSSTHGYDPDYAKNSLGMITLLNSIEACATRGVKDFNLLWGDQPYKRHFGADRVKLHTVVIARSARALVDRDYIVALTYFGWLDVKRRLKPAVAWLREKLPRRRRPVVYSGCVLLSSATSWLC